MKKIILYKIFVLLSICLIGCITQNNSKVEIEQKKEQLTLKVFDNQIEFQGDSLKSYSTVIRIGDIATIRKNIKGRSVEGLVSILKTDSCFYNDIAFLLARNNGDINISFSVDRILDTIITCHFDYKNVAHYKAQMIEGRAAKLINHFDNPDVEANIRRWMYRQGFRNVENSTIDKMRLYLKELHRTGIREYTSSENIPVITSFKNIHYRIQSDLVADNYYLFACKSDDELAEFVEEMIALNFQASKKTLTNSLPCLREPNASNLNCIFLVGIDKDWRYQAIPIGLVCIDNSAPSHLLAFDRIDEKSQLPFYRHNILVKSNKLPPTIIGTYDITSGHFQGWSPYNIPYTIKWNGDVSKVVIHTGKASTKTIYLKDKESPYYTNISTHLNMGDNYIKIDVYDYVGNKSKYDLHINVVEVEDEHPQIVNNIWN